MLLDTAYIHRVQFDKIRRPVINKTNNKFDFYKYHAVSPSMLAIAYGLAIACSGKAKKISLAGMDGWKDNLALNNEMENLIKSYIKNILKKYNLKLIKINTRKNKVHPYSKPSIINLKCILDSSGVLHIGAHRGTEASAYDWLHKKVLWIEVNPAIFEDLSENIKKYFDQKYICALVGDENKKNVNFYISNNDSACSSIFDFSSKDICPDSLA